MSKNKDYTNSKMINEQNLTKESINFNLRLTIDEAEYLYELLRDILDEESSQENEIAPTIINKVHEEIIWHRSLIRWKQHEREKHEPLTNPHVLKNRGF